MGTATVHNVFPASDLAGLKKAVEQKTEDDCRQHGIDPYSGTLSTKKGHGVQAFEDRIFATSMDASDWLTAQDPYKRGPSMAARFVRDRLGPTPELTACEEEVVRLQQELTALPAAMIATARAAKAATRGCKACKSTVAVAWIGKGQARDHFGRPKTCCPICGDEGFLATKTTTARRERLVAALQTATERQETVATEAKAALVRTASAKDCPWMVVSACSC